MDNAEKYIKRINEEMYPQQIEPPPKRPTPRAVQKLNESIIEKFIIDKDKKL